MYQTIASSGLPIDPFAMVEDAASIMQFAAEHGWPVVVKPCMASSSEGVLQVTGPGDVGRVSFETPLVAQAHNPHSVYHVDGLFGGLDLGPWRAARYLNTCLDFRQGSYLGSVEEDDPSLNGSLGTWTERFLRALTCIPVVFHLEVFVDRQGSADPRCSFLEVGARVGGGETALLWREVHEVDLMKHAFGLQAGFDLPEVPRLRWPPGEVAGHLLIPAPCVRPCRITRSTPMAGRDPGPYAEVVPQPGDVLPDSASFYEHVGGRFRFRGRSSDVVRGAILATARGFQVDAEPLSSGASQVGAPM